MSEAKRRRVLKAKNVRYLPNKIGGPCCTRRNSSSNQKPVVRTQW